MFYFAYGSNMNHAQMQKVCPGAKFVATARLPKYCLVFDGCSPGRHGAVVNLEPMENEEVYGGLYEVTPDHFRSLDDFEGYPKSHSREQFMFVRLDTHEKVKAVTYFRDPQAPGMPSREYLSSLMQGAKDCHLPEEYIRVSFEVLPHGDSSRGY